MSPRLQQKSRTNRGRKTEQIHCELSQLSHSTTALLTSHNGDVASKNSDCFTKLSRLYLKFLFWPVEIGRNSKIKIHWKYTYLFKQKIFTALFDKIAPKFGKEKILLLGCCANYWRQMCQGSRKTEIPTIGIHFHIVGIYFLSNWTYAMILFGAV